MLVALSDSTNAERPGYTLSEKVVGTAIMDIFRTAKQRIILATFASNIHRIQQVIDAAVYYRRKVAIVGRSMENVVSIAQELGYLIAPEGTIVEVDDLAKFPRKSRYFNYGQPGRTHVGTDAHFPFQHRKVEIMPGDTVIISHLPFRAMKNWFSGLLTICLPAVHM